MSASVACAVGRLSVSVRVLLVVDTIGTAVDVVDVVVPEVVGGRVLVREATGVHPTGDEAAALPLQIRANDRPLEEGSNRRARQRHAEQEADGVGDESGGEQEGARGDQQAAVHEFLGRYVTGRQFLLKATDCVTALGPYQQHSDDAGEDDQRDGRRCTDGVGDDDEQQSVGEGDEQQEDEHPAQAHNRHYRVPTHSPFDVAAVDRGMAPLPET